MVLDITEQVIERIRLCTSILILLGNKPSGDEMASALGLKTFLSKLEKQAVIVAPLNELNEKFNFLPGFNEVLQSFDFVKNFVIDISTKRVAIEELSYKKEPDKLSIFLKPKAGQIDSADISFRSSTFPFELIMCIGVPSLDQLGNFYGANAELFFETPIVNIDHSSQNENYGQFNLVKLTSSSTSEIVFDLINAFEGSLIDNQIATSLLAGIIAETNSFQHIRTTPAAFMKASHLVNLGADQQGIVRQLYKTKTVGFLKLWGRVLARLKTDPQLMLAYSEVNQSDIAKSVAEAIDQDSIIKEMSLQLSFAKTFLFLVENPNNSTTIYLATHMPVNLLNLFAAYKPEVIGQSIKFILFKNVREAETLVLDLVKGEFGKIAI